MTTPTAVDSASDRDEVSTTQAMLARATRRLYTDAGLHRQLLPQGVDPCIPREATGRREVRAERDPCYPNNNSSNAAKTDEARRRGRAWPPQRLSYTRHSTDEDTGSAAAHTHITIIMHGEREAKTTKTTTQLNRRYPAEQPAGVINRELFEAPGTRRPHIAIVRQAALVGHGAQPFFMGSCNFVHPKR